MGRSTTRGYIIANIVVTDPERYDRYKPAAPAVIARFGGRYLVKAPDIEVLEGSLAIERLVVLEFDSLDKARTFYFSPEYQAVAADRLASSRSDVLIVEGAAALPRQVR